MSGVVKQFSVEEEYVKNPDISRDDIRKMREWLNTQPHLPGEHVTDLDLFITFHCCEKSAEVSKQVLDLHYTLRTLFTPLFKDRVLDHRIRNLLNTILIAPLPMRTVHQYRALYGRLIDNDPKKFVFTDLIRTALMIYDLWQYEEGTWPGFVIIIDMDETTLGHIARLDVMTIRQFLYFLQQSWSRERLSRDHDCCKALETSGNKNQNKSATKSEKECMLVKLKEVHFLNAPSFMEKLMMLIRPFMKKELLDIIYIHESGSKKIFNYVPLEAFPKEFGGEHKDRITLRDEIIRRIENNYQFFKDENLRRVNEALRPGGKKTVEDLFGIQGSFKKLDID